MGPNSRRTRITATILFSLIMVVSLGAFVPTAMAQPSPHPDSGLVVDVRSSGGDSPSGYKVLWSGDQGHTGEVVNYSPEPVKIHLDPGTYRLLLIAQGHHPSVTNMTVNESGFSNVNITLQSDGPTITGAITDVRTGEPVGGAVVEADAVDPRSVQVDEDSSGFERNLTPPTSRVMSTADGRYAIDVDGGLVEFAVEADGYESFVRRVDVRCDLGFNLTMKPVDAESPATPDGEGQESTDIEGPVKVPPCENGTDSHENSDGATTNSTNFSLVTPGLAVGVGILVHSRRRRQ